MKSAFGVEHPDQISKVGFKMPKMPKVPGSGAGKHMGAPGAASVGGGAHKTGLMSKITPLAQKIGANTKGAGQVGISAIKNNKGIAGGAAGAGTLGAGGGYMAGRKKNP